MRIQVDLSSHVLGILGAGGAILQAEKSPPVGSTGTPINGKFMIPVEEGMETYLSSSSYVLPVDGGDVCSQSFALLLAQYPQYEYLYFNPLLTPTDVALLDPTEDHTFQNVPDFPLVGPDLQTRVFTGYPLAVSLPPVNPVTLHPGLVMTLPITDVGTWTGAVGADNFMVWWKIYQYEVSDDVHGTGSGALGSTNTPAIKRIKEIDQEPADFRVFISSDDGANWFLVNRLTPMVFCAKATEVRLMFWNESTTARYVLASYAILF